jgi:hypothetical protein
MSGAGGGAIARYPRPAGVGRWGWRPTTGLRPVPRGGSAPATLENHFLEGETGGRRVPPAGRARAVEAGSNRIGGAAPHIETPFTQNT